MPPLVLFPVILLTIFYSREKKNCEVSKNLLVENSFHSKLILAVRLLITAWTRIRLGSEH